MVEFIIQIRGVEALELTSYNFIIKISEQCFVKHLTLI